MADSDSASITVTPNGPYLVTGGLPLSVETIALNDRDECWEYEPVRTFEAQKKYALCRCGASATKPFCDGTHAKIDFDGSETASRTSYATQAEVTAGPTMDLSDAPDLCSFARFCDGSGSIWKLIAETDSEATRELVKHQGSHCPSGRLVVTDHAPATTIEPAYDPALVLLEDPQKSCSGPIAVRGGIRLTSADGYDYEIRNRMALCRCGKSANKPFCDGTHADIAFVDGL